MASIYVDADACPVVVKEILFRAATRTRTSLTLVANQSLHVPRSPHIRSVTVPKGFDVADHEIARLAHAGDLVITNDIPLAAEVLAKGADALSPRGEMWSKDTIGARLNMRDFNETLRASGINTSGPPPLSQGDRKAFAGHLDRWLSAARNRGS